MKTLTVQFENLWILRPYFNQAVNKQMLKNPLFAKSYRVVKICRAGKIIIVYNEASYDFEEQLDTSVKNVFINLDLSMSYVKPQHLLIKMISPCSAKLSSYFFHHDITRKMLQIS
ncbi:CLUMA_CG021071, isoform A [Clunio marinus]|uniref:CLUMA_CG021071, isoform A n=1 Tax=Clunio marinus TaxID=568069 RepID=A0A1J1J946_9DIPT|nr:CLUMA_CG021071, isoform A [Clunio marinus]